MIQVFCYKSTKPERSVYHASLFLYSLPERDTRMKKCTGKSASQSPRRAYWTNSVCLVSLDKILSRDIFGILKIKTR